MSGRYRLKPLPEPTPEERQKARARLRPGARQRLQGAIARHMDQQDERLEGLRANYLAAQPGRERAEALRHLARWYRDQAREIDRCAGVELLFEGFWGNELVQGMAGASADAIDALALDDKTEAALRQGLR